MGNIRMSEEEFDDLVPQETRDKLVDLWGNSTELRDEQGDYEIETAIIDEYKYTMETRHIGISRFGKEVKGSDMLRTFYVTKNTRTMKNKVLELDDKEFESLLKKVLAKPKTSEADIVMISEARSVESLLSCCDFVDDNGEEYIKSDCWGNHLRDLTIENLLELEIDWDRIQNGAFNKALSVSEKSDHVLGGDGQWVWRDTGIYEVNYYNEWYGHYCEPELYETELSKVSCFVADYGERNVPMNGWAGATIGRPSLVAIRKSIK